MVKSLPTITLEFKLYCHDSWKKSLLGTTLFTTATISTLIMGIISNKYGRKMPLFFSLFFGSIGSILIGFS